MERARLRDIFHKPLAQSYRLWEGQLGSITDRESINVILSLGANATTTQRASDGSRRKICCSLGRRWRRSRLCPGLTGRRALHLVRPLLVRGESGSLVMHISPLNQWPFSRTRPLVHIPPTLSCTHLLPVPSTRPNAPRRVVGDAPPMSPRITCSLCAKFGRLYRGEEGGARGLGFFSS